MESSPGEIDYRVGPKELIEEFKQNATRAEEKYDGTTVAVTGEIDGLPNTGEKISVYFDGGGIRAVYFYFPDSRIDEVNSLSWGDKVTLIGEYRSYDGSVWFVDSYVE